MTLQKHLAIDIEKIQSGVSRMDAQKLARRFLHQFAESADLDADLIVGHVCRLSRLDLMTKGEVLMAPDECQRARELLERRSLGEPVAYLLGHKEFYGLDFKVDERVLIPRPDTEILVEAAIESLKDLKSPRVIDVCTGTGCIAISIAANVKEASVIAIDISPGALEVARENAHALGVSERVEFRQGNLLEPCANERGVDLIVSNPPYIRGDEMPTLMRDVRDFEPHLALLGERPDGLGLHCKIVAQSLEILKPGGILLMEIGEGQAEILLKEIFLGFSRAEFLKDYVGILRVVKFVREGI